MDTKETIRNTLREIRKNIKPKRREEARKNAFLFLKVRLAQFQRILSFVSTQEELDLTPLNEWLCSEKKLYLPKIHENHLLVFQVKDLKTELLFHSRFPIQEPNDKLCKEVSLSAIDCILVPAIAFDAKRYRLGFGKGFYDRLLEKSHAHSIGIGFKEQMSPSLLPIEPHDQKLSELALF